MIYKKNNPSLFKRGARGEFIIKLQRDKEELYSKL